MANYLEKIQYLYPDIQRVMYWHTQPNNNPWEDPYDGIIWENTEIKKPSKKTLDNLNDGIIEQELAKRNELKNNKNSPLKDIENLIANNQLQIDSITKIIQDNYGQLSNQIKTLNLDKLDLENAIRAIRGFIMILPEIQKTLLEIKRIILHNNNVINSKG